VPVVLRHWKLEEQAGLSGEAEEARTRVLSYMARLGNVARRLAERRQAKDGQLIDA
jgi:hypothetical protein